MKSPHRWIPPRDELLAKPWMKPFSRYLVDDRLWHMNRESVARGVAIGLFIGLLFPVAQFVFAVLVATALRGQVAVSAACTLITNPLTFTPIYWLAYQIGGSLLPARPAALPGVADAHDWLMNAWLWVQSAGMPLMTGLLVLACSGAVLGYAGVRLLWRQQHPHQES